ncbi:MAG: gliding motility-associated C-terminal domain-containing protein [Bacteroidia bacterium]|nr:gliding motility-associated C-terminal domain-containing protein [Bacteroidia bacterium]
MRIAPFLFFVAFGSVCIAQNQFINAGTDTTLCAGNATLTASVTNIPQSTAYTVASIPYAPVVPFNQGTVLPVPVDDEYSGVIPIGFTFCFYGTPHTDLLISTNNYLCFDLTQANQYSPWPINAAIPDPNYLTNMTPVDAIMGPWVDIDPSVGGIIRYNTYGTAPFRYFVVSFENVPYFSCNNLLYTGQMVLFETTNIIETHIMLSQICSTWNGGAAIHGLHNNNGTQADFVTGRNYPTQWQVTNDGYRWSPSGPPTSYTIAWTDLSNLQNVGNTAQITVTPTTNTCYQATVTYGCSNASFSDTVCVNIGIPGLSLTSGNILCNGQTNGSANITVTGPGPYTYNWSTGATTPGISGLGAGVYTVTVSDGNCTYTGTVTVTEPLPLTVLGANGTDTCSIGTGFTAVIPSGGTGPYSYQWSNGQTGASATGLNAGTYSCVITDANGCTTTVSQNVGNLAGPTAVINTSQTSYATNEPVQFSDGSSGGGGNLVAWTWIIGTNTYTTQNPPPQTYTTQGNYCATLIVTNSLGCTDSTTDCILIADSVMIPNVITPNGDGQNDMLEFKNLEAYPGSRLMIYNRWGNLIYENGSYANDWNAKNVSDGTYYFILTVNDGKNTVRYGYLTVLKNK